jgi:uncharacterized protein YbjT (DUF2867 family)
LGKPLRPECQIASTFHSPLSTLIVPLHGTAKIVFHGLFFTATGLTNLCVLPATLKPVITSQGGNEKSKRARFEEFWEGDLAMILITCASGTVGKTVLREVAKTGAAHRAMYRSKDEAAKAPAGTQTVIADFSDKASLASALKGIESVYLVCSPIPQLVEFESNVVDACQAAGVRGIVQNSALGAADYPKSFPSWHRKVEDKLKTTKIAHCILRPNSFMQNIVAYYAPTIRTQGAIYGSYGNARISYIDVRDLAAVAAKALTSSALDGKTLELNGPEALTCEQVAQKISERTGIAARYVDIPMEAQRKAMLDQKMPEWQVTALIELQQYYINGQGGATDRTLADVLGRPPVTLDQFLTEHASEFRSQAAKA